ncbi:MAG: ArnT family glycosyltransferase, partial [Planctomycetia bacterium]
MAFHRFTDELTAYRLSSATQFAAAGSLLFLFLARRYGAYAGIAAAAALWLHPRVFGHAHLAATETPLA